MDLTKDINAWGFFGLVLQLFSCVLLGISPDIKSQYQICAPIGVSLAFLLLSIGHRKTRVEMKIKKQPAKSSSELTKQAVRVLASMYAVIAGLSLTTAVKEFSLLQDISLGLENTVAFFATALPFYNGVTMFLITNYYLKGFEGRVKEPLIDFLLLFSGAIALYGMAINIANQRSFVISLLILVLVNAVWVSNVLLREWRHEIPREWLWLDFYMFIFLGPLILFSFQLSAGILAVVATFRTAADYYVAGRYYLPT